MPSSSALNVDGVNRASSSSKQFHKQNKHFKGNSATHKKKVSFSQNIPLERKCKRCGKTPQHAFKDCPAKNAICSKCSRKGHYANVCYSVNTIETEKLHDDLKTFFLGAIYEKNYSKTNWEVDIKIGNKILEFKIDTGADVNVISENDFKELQNVHLQETSAVLYGPGQKQLPVLGRCRIKMQLNDKESDQDVFVLEQLHKPLLGKPAIEALGILARVHLTEKRPPEENFPELFEGLGKLREEFKHKIQLKESSIPFAITCPRRIPIPLMGAVQEELQRMLRLGVIFPVEEPTDWCAGMVVVPKPDGTVRICVDLTNLNNNVKRERYILPAVEHTLGQLGEARIFSKLDANCGFWQIELDRESALLTTFLTPFGRFAFNRLPYGISSAPEIYQRTMHKILLGLKGVTGQTDDTLVYARDEAEHDDRLQKALERIKAAGMTLNKKKCKFRTSEVDFLGQTISAEGVQPSKDKLKAVVEMPIPTNVTDLKRFLGMVNYLSKFIPNLASKAVPLHDLLRKGNMWRWDSAQQEAMKEIKNSLLESTILSLYDCKLPTRITTDASSYGLGAVLEQCHKEEWKPVAFASKTLSETEQRYSTIEKEALGVLWGCEKFRDFLLGMTFHIVTDHKPLVPLLSTKHLDELSPRLQRFRMRLMRFSYTISHSPGKDMVVADALSRGPNSSTQTDTEFESAIECHIDAVLRNFPISDEKLIQLRRLQQEDDLCQMLQEATLHGWKTKERILPELKPYWQHRADFSFHQGLLLKGQQLVIPKSMQNDILDRIHEGHLGITKCKERARNSVWWHGIGRHITEKILSCEVCVKERPGRLEPMIPSTLPDRPWQKVGLDLMEFRAHTYLVVVDYFSKYPEMVHLSTTTSAAVINCLKSIFSRHGIPELVHSDNGPQFISDAFAQFGKTYGFRHTTSSPHYPKSNGQAEATVKIVKGFLKKCEDPYLGLLAYRNTPLAEGSSPAQLLMGRRLRTTLPVPQETLIPKWPDLTVFHKRNEKKKNTQKRQYDTRHGTRDLPQLSPGDQVWIPANKMPGVVLNKTPFPRSYAIETPSGTLRRNRHHLRKLEQSHETAVRHDTVVHDNQATMTSPVTTAECATQLSPPSSAETHMLPPVPVQHNDSSQTSVYITRSGRPSVKPQRLFM